MSNDYIPSPAASPWNASVLNMTNSPFPSPRGRTDDRRISIQPSSPMTTIPWKSSPIKEQSQGQPRKIILSGSGMKDSHNIHDNQVPKTEDRIRFGSETISLHRETFDKILGSAVVDLFGEEDEAENVRISSPLKPLKQTNSLGGSPKRSNKDRKEVKDLNSFDLRSSWINRRNQAYDLSHMETRQSIEIFDHDTSDTNPSSRSSRLESNLINKDDASPWNHPVSYLQNSRESSNVSRGPPEDTNKNDMTHNMPLETMRQGTEDTVTRIPFSNYQQSNSIFKEERLEESSRNYHKDMLTLEDHRTLCKSIHDELGQTDTKDDKLPVDVLRDRIMRKV